MTAQAPVEDIPRSFAEAFAAQDAEALAAHLTEDAQVQTLTGLWADTAQQARAAFAMEFAGIFAQARLVRGKTQIRPIGPGAAVLHQRYVVIGAQGEDGAELPRFTAVLALVVLARPEGWRAVSLTFTPLGA